MAHMIEMFVGRSRAWHGLGLVVGAWLTLREALTASRMDGAVTKVPALAPGLGYLPPVGDARLQLAYALDTVCAHISTGASSPIPTWARDAILGLVSVTVPTHYATVREHGGDDLDVLRQRLQRAVASEEYADAARLRDRLASPERPSLEPLGIVGERYQVLHEMDVVAPIVDAICNTGDAIIETIMRLQNGSYCASVRLPDIAGMPGDVPLASYLVVRWSHDGSTFVEYWQSGILVVCWNTMTMSRSNANEIVKVKHTSGASLRIGNVLEALNVNRSQMERMRDAAREMSTRDLSRIDASNMIRTLFPGKVVEGREQVSARITTMRQDVMTAFDGASFTGADMLSRPERRSRYGLYQCVTEYLDHTRPTKGGARGRWESSMFGDGAAKRELAWDVLASAAPIPDPTPGVRAAVLLV